MVVVPVESEVAEVLEVDGAGADASSDPVAFDAAVADLAVTVADEPGEGPFDYWPVPPVDGVELGCVGLAAGGGEEPVVLVEVDGATAGAGRAARRHGHRQNPPSRRPRQPRRP